jgi:hypothetical protein
MKLVKGTSSVLRKSLVRKQMLVGTLTSMLLLKRLGKQISAYCMGHPIAHKYLTELINL